MEEKRYLKKKKEIKGLKREIKRQRKREKDTTEETKPCLGGYIFHTPKRMIDDSARPCKPIVNNYVAVSNQNKAACELMCVCERVSV
jgi:hypothetical protein